MKQRMISFEEFIAPLSRNKVMLVVECIDIIGCDSPEIRDEIGEILNLQFGPDCEEWEDFLDKGYIVLDAEINSENVAWCKKVVDLLQNCEDYYPIIQVDLFVDGALMRSSWQANSASCQDGPPQRYKTVVIPFPVDRRTKQQD